MNRGTSGDVNDFLANVKNERRRTDAHTVVEMMHATSNENPRLWGISIIGFGETQYQLAGGTSEAIFRIGFSPRASALVFCLGELAGKSELLSRLGKHKRGASCIYINKLADVDQAVLQEVFRTAYHA